MTTMAEIVRRKRIDAMRNYLKRVIDSTFDKDPAIVDTLTDAEVVEAVPEGMAQFFGFVQEAAP